jgi:hypothetical protein
VTTALDIHPFEKAHLGSAPFRFIGTSEKVYCACPGALEQPAGTCDYCGNGIRYVYHVRSADGREFGVGCDCIRKVDRASLVNVTEFERAVAAQERKLRQARTAARNAKTQARIDAAMARYDASPEIQAAFAARPHPFTAMAAEGRTMADYVEWMRRMAGLSGMTRIAKMIEDIR